MNLDPINLVVSHPLGLTLALLPEVTLTGAAILVLLWVTWRHRTARHSRVAAWVSFAGLLAAGLALAWLWLGHARARGTANMIALDDFRYATAALVLLATLVTVVLSMRYLEREGLLAPEYYVLLLFAAIGMLLLGGAEDFMVLFLGLEVMSVAVYVLVGYHRRTVFSAEAALKYFLIGAFASAFLLYGIALLYGVTGTTDLAEQGALLARGELPRMATLGLGLLLIGLGFKVAAVPFHMWAPDAYDGAPTPVAGFMATGVKVAAFAALARVLLFVFGTSGPVWGPVVAGLAVLSMAAGNFIALQQRSLKRMLAYSSVAHAGYLLAALVPGSGVGLTAVLVYLGAYVLTSLLAFGILAGLGHEGERDVTLDTIAGLSQQRPWLAAGLAVSMLSLLGFPGTLGFIGKWVILVGLLGSGHAVVAVVLVLASLVSAGYYLPVIMAAYMRSAPEGAPRPGTPFSPPAAGALAAAVILLLVLGLWPSPALDLAQASALSLYEPVGVIFRYANP